VRRQDHSPMRSLYIISTLGLLLLPVLPFVSNEGVENVGECTVVPSAVISCPFTTPPIWKTNTTAYHEKWHDTWTAQETAHAGTPFWGKYKVLEHWSWCFRWLDVDYPHQRGVRCLPGGLREVIMAGLRHGCSCTDILTPRLGISKSWRPLLRSTCTVALPSGQSYQTSFVVQGLSWSLSMRCCVWWKALQFRKRDWWSCLENFSSCGVFDSSPEGVSSSGDSVSLASHILGLKFSSK
jgi:hypothetical protein